MSVPSDRKYSETHEWYLVNGDIVTIGITQYAADELNDITYVDLPEVGTSFGSGDAIGELESVKATSELLTSVGGRVVEVNTALADHPELINEDAFEEGWLVKIKASSLGALEAMMAGAEYQAFLKNQE
ncbi:MAG: glycine cleavage system protein GcvH [Planctomycetes bacterium]|nr:glycine cleavage system protein GcvH [Planctomycetota bacterium]